MSETLFKEVKYDLSSLIGRIEIGDIGLPDIQRPFVWKNTKVRDLFDSMYRGYPVGYLLLWQNALTDGVRTVGVDSKQKVPNLLIVDGQQRLTSLYAVVKGIPVVRKDYQQESIEIAFNPLFERFEVADAAIRRDKSFIPNISSLWSKETDVFELVDNYFAGLGSDEDLAPEEKKKIKSAIMRLSNLLSFPFYGSRTLRADQRRGSGGGLCPHQQQGYTAKPSGLHSHAHVGLLGQGASGSRKVLR